MPGIPGGLNSGTSWRWNGPLAWTIVVIGAACVGAMLTWHVVYAWRHLPRSASLAFALSRAAIAAFYCLVVGPAAAVGPTSAAAVGIQYTVHLHHYLIAWWFASFGAFNRVPSAVLLAAGAGVLAQARPLAFPPHASTQSKSHAPSSVVWPGALSSNHTSRSF